MHSAYHKPQTLVIKVKNEELTLSPNECIRWETGAIDRGHHESDNEIVIDPKERERNLIIKENDQRYSELKNNLG
jgi:hypothetical protein